MNNQNFSVYILVGLTVLVVIFFVLMNFQSSNQPVLELPSGGTSTEISIFSKPEGKIVNESQLEEEFNSLEVMEDSELDIE